jgi:hypothetical protein
MDIPALCADSVRIARDKGWLDKPRKFSTITALIHSEWSEALEDYRAHHKLTEIYFVKQWKDGGVDFSMPCSPDEPGSKPCGIPVEIADVVIRIAQHCGAEGWDLGAAMLGVSLPDPDKVRDFEDFEAEGHLATSLAYGASITKDPERPPVFFLALAMKLILDFCGRNAIDLDTAVAMKQAYNEGRPFRHGGKLI